MSLPATAMDTRRATGHLSFPWGWSSVGVEASVLPEVSIDDDQRQQGNTGEKQSHPECEDITVAAPIQNFS